MRMQGRSRVTSRSVARRPGRALGSADTALLSPPGAGSPTSAREQGRIYPQRLPGTALRVGVPFRQGFLQPFLVSQEAPHLPNTTWPCPCNPATPSFQGPWDEGFPFHREGGWRGWHSKPREHPHTRDSHLHLTHRHLSSHLKAVFSQFISSSYTAHGSVQVRGSSRRHGDVLP